MGHEFSSNHITATVRGAPLIQLQNAVQKAVTGPMIKGVARKIL